MPRQLNLAKLSHQRAAWNLAWRTFERISKANELQGADEVIELMKQKESQSNRLVSQIRWPDIERIDRDDFDLLTRLDALPRTLVEARLAVNWKQGEFARQLGWNRQMVVRYEKSAYASAPLHRLIEVSRVFCERREQILEARSKWLDGRIDFGVDAK